MRLARVTLPRGSTTGHWPRITAWLRSLAESKAWHCTPKPWGSVMLGEIHLHDCYRTGHRLRMRHHEQPNETPGVARSYAGALIEIPSSRGRVDRWTGARPSARRNGWRTLRSPPPPVTSSAPKSRHHSFLRRVLCASPLVYPKSPKFRKFDSDAQEQLRSA